jgi:hypothetical protein
MSATDCSSATLLRNFSTLALFFLVFGSTIENNSLSIGSGFDRRQHSVQFRFRDQFPSKHYRIDLLIIGDVAKGVASSKIDY